MNHLSLLRISLAVALAACNASQAHGFANPQAHASPHGYAYADLTRLAKHHPFYDAVIEYDRQIAALKATQQGVGRPAVDPSSARTQAQNAASTIVALAKRSKSYVSLSNRMLDPVSLQAEMERAYAQQAANVRSKAGNAEREYGEALRAEQQNAVGALARSLETRVEAAYGARAQQLREREATDALVREKSVENHRLLLQLRLADLRPQPDERTALKKQLDAMNGSLERADRSEERHDEATLAAYLASLRSAAAAEFARASGQLRSKAEANWQLRQSVTQAQLAEPAQLNLGSNPGSSAFASTNPGQASDALVAAGNDIAGRMESIDARSGAAETDAAGEIQRLRLARAQLFDDIVALVRRSAERVAASRGLRFVDRPVVGAIDISSATLASFPPR